MKFILIIVAIILPVALMSNLFKRQLQLLPGTPSITSPVTQSPLPCSTVVNGGGCYPLSQCSGASTQTSTEGVYLVTPGFQICDRDSVTKEPYFCCNKIPDATTPATTTTITTITTTTKAPEPPFECAKIKSPGFPPIWTRRQVLKQNIPLLPVAPVLGGTNAGKDKYPYMAALFKPDQMNNKKLFCGASIISQRSLLTAAHCFINQDLNAKFVAVIGDYILGNSMDGNNAIEVEVEKIILHPDFKMGQVYNDIAILVLKTTLNFNASITPVCLPSKQLVNETFAGVSSVVTGWGRNKYDGSLQNTLQSAVIPVITQQECQNVYSGLKGAGEALPNGITIDIICAGLYNDTRRDTCQGDSGGPLVTADPNVSSQWIQIGVVSAGPDCGLAYPGLYTRTTRYLDWIAANRVPTMKCIWR